MPCGDFQSSHTSVTPTYILKCFLGGGWGHGFLWESLPWWTSVTLTHRLLSASGEKGRGEKLRITDRASVAISRFSPSVLPLLGNVHWGFHSESTGEPVLVTLNQKVELSSSKHLVEDACLWPGGTAIANLAPQYPVSPFLGVCRDRGKCSHVTWLLSYCLWPKTKPKQKTLPQSILLAFSGIVITWETE